jgi:hypothetical protein
MGHLLAIGGLQVITPGYGGLKSMHTLGARVKGAGRKVLHALTKQAVTIGLQAVNLEIGSEGPF